MKKRKNNKKLIIILFAIFIIIILLIITLTMWSFKSYKIIETKTFSEIPGFTFEYPVFEGWEVSMIKKINSQEYNLFLTDGNPRHRKVDEKFQPRINIKKKGATHIDPKEKNFNINNNKVKYYSFLKQELDGMPYINFYADSFTIVIHPFLHEGDGYSGKIMTEKIIETFNFLPKITLIIKNETKTLGTIDFSETNSGELNITSKSKDAENLEKTWDKIKNKTLTYDFENKEGDKLAMYSKITKPSESDFKWGVYEYLTKQGFLVEAKEK